MDNRKRKLIEHAEKVFEKVDEYRRLGLVCDDGDFVPSVHYPPITQYPDRDADACLNDYVYPEDGCMDLYIHIPFCLRHCIFCHYPGMVGECKEEKEKYISYLLS